MSGQEGIIIENRMEHAARLVDALPSGNYSDHYQPEYGDQDALVSAVAEVCNTPGVTTPGQIKGVAEQLGAIGRGESRLGVVILGKCAEPVSLNQSIAEHVRGAHKLHAVVACSALGGHVLEAQRNRGQYTKPRSNPMELVEVPGPDGATVVIEVPSYQGDSVNGRDVQHREADPDRLVAAAVQARDVESELTRTNGGQHLIAAHEALLLPYEHAFVRIDPASGRRYLASADIPWIGVRTNSPDGAHVGLLSSIENPVGVKLGAATTEDHVAGLSEMLNPQGKAGKLLFMLRLGLRQPDEHIGILEAIKRHEPNSIVMYDIHGVTRTDARTGKKIRSVAEITEGIGLLARSCARVGLRMHGVHLEVTDDPTARQCVMRPDQLPHDAGQIDPNLNPVQAKKVLDETARIMGITHLRR